jgi:hypothetical protein
MDDPDCFRAEQFEQDKLHNYSGHELLQQWPDCFNNLWHQTPDPRRHSSTSSSTSQYPQAMEHDQKLIEQYQPHTGMPIPVSSSMLPLNHPKPLVDSHSGLMINMSDMEPMHEHNEQPFGMATAEPTFGIPPNDIALRGHNMALSSQTLPLRHSTMSSYAVSYVDEQERAEELQQQQNQQLEEQHELHEDPASYEYAQNVDSGAQSTSRSISNPHSPAFGLDGSSSTTSPTPPPPFATGPTDLMDTIPGQSLLHIAAGKGHRKILDLLLQRGGIAVLNSRDVEGFTPLQRAVYSGHMEIVQLLLDHGADIATVV